MGQGPSTRPKEHRAERRAPPTVERCLVPPAPGESGTPIILQGLPKRRRGTADDPKGRAERPRTFPRGSSYVCRRFPRRACDSLKLPPCRSLPINSVGDRVTNCLRSFPLNAQLANNPANRDLYVRPCVNNRPDKPKTLDRQAIFDVPFAQFLPQFSPRAVTFWPWCWGRLGLRRGEFSARGRLQWPKS
jgi:hypothetical protein